MEVDQETTQLRNWLRELHNSGQEISDWEAEFMESNLGGKWNLSDAQKKVVNKMREKYTIN